MHILLVEDEKTLAGLMREILTDEGYQVDVQFDGEAGLHQALTTDYDLIILDVMLPGIDGYRLCRRLRTEGLTTPVLMLTARGDVADRVRGLDVGADDYLVKPFSFEELTARLRALSRRPPAYAGGDRLQVGDILLDRAARLVFVKGDEVNLTPREFDLLELLMLNPQRVLTREIITDRVWGPGYDPTGNHVDTYIHFLRRKVGAKQIRSVRGVGYMLHDGGAKGK